ncbi:MAG: stage III sporulation protein AB [Ruminococcus sp.]|nr:stage III sporulation protein AB [Ruminococcus sp.]
MIRLAGCLLIIYAGALCGITAASSLTKRRKTLEKVIALLKYTSELIRYKKYPVEELMYEIRQNEANKRLLEQELEEYLSVEEKKTFERFLSDIGGSDQEGQQAMISLYITEFERYAGFAVKKEAENGRLYRILGFMSGVFLTLIII